VRLLDEELGGLAGRRVLVLGLAYREDVKELAFSVALRLVDLLRRSGATCLVHDPLFTRHEVEHVPAEFVDLDRPLDVDAVIVQAYHRAYRNLKWRCFRGLRAVLDGRGALEPEQLAGTGARYLAIGLPIAP
jgi:UDP-N-acetyl-D-mannosaminuronic acid dehydrogenase